MPIVVGCQCGKRYQAPDSKAGEILLCPSCKAHMQVPTPQHEPPDVPPATPPAIAALDLADPDYAPPAATTPYSDAPDPNIFRSEYPWYYGWTVGIAWTLAVLSCLAVIGSLSAAMNAQAEYAKKHEHESTYSESAGPGISASVVLIPAYQALVMTGVACAATVLVDAAQHIRRAAP